jgi:DNA polymerase-3 subunit gamma/tau
MSYQVLARKWRPQNFKQMVGQEHVLKALIHALDSQRLHHAYLFTGTRGVGKTTIGRILAKCLSCHDKITSEPCGKCAACTSIAEGRYLDLIEIDAASRTKVEDMRELLENVQYAPTQGRFKIYLIDEVHMLSQSSFNALLKTLEEPPEHVKFLFATTDPQKLPVTILSRCLQFNLKNMSPENIVSHLSFVLNEEKVTFEDPALWAIALAADGSMRDALSLTDQAIAYGNNSLSESGVSAMLGTVDQKKVYRILDALIRKDAPAMFAEVKGLADFSPDYRSVLATISSILHRVALEQVVPGSADNSMGDKEQVKKYSKILCAEDVQLFYQIALTSRQDLHISPDTKSGFEMALLRMLAFQLSPVDPSDRVLLDSQLIDETESLGAYDHHSSSISSNEPAPEVNDLHLQATEQQAASNGQESFDSSEPETVVSMTESPESTLLDSSNMESSVGITQIDSHLKEVVQFDDLASGAISTDNEFQKDAPSANNEALESEEIEKKNVNEVPDNLPSGWNAQVLELDLTGMTLNFMLNSVVELAQSNVRVFIESGHFRLFNENHEKRVRESLLAYFKDCSDVEFIDGLLESHETPMMWRERKLEEKKLYAKELIFKDPYVKEIISEFQARLIEQSIQPEV